VKGDFDGRGSISTIPFVFDCRFSRHDSRSILADFQKGRIQPMVVSLDANSRRQLSPALLSSFRAVAEPDKKFKLTNYPVAGSFAALKSAYLTTRKSHPKTALSS
jgi:hypothetical protein